MKVYLEPVGACRRRLLDLERVAEFLSKNDYSMTYNPKIADFIILFTCAFNQNKEGNSIKKVDQYSKYKGKVIVSGCLPAINRDILKKYTNLFEITPIDLKKFDKIMPHSISITKIKDKNILNYSKSNKNVVMLNMLNGMKYQKKSIDKFKDTFLEQIFLIKKEKVLKSYYIRVGVGCMGNCSYCAIKKATGKLKSKSLVQCVQEFNDGLSKGYNHFSLLGEDVGAYGLDRNTTILNLLQKICSYKKKYKIKILDFNPKWIIKYREGLYELLKEGKIEWISIPIESGSERILKYMGRCYDIKKIIKAIDNMRKIKQDIIIETHIMVGFPKEKREDFRKTLSLLKNLKFDCGHINSYSDKKGTKSYKILPKVSDGEKVSRMKCIEKILKINGYHTYLGGNYETIHFFK
ncbi:MAG: radical SAM protein [Nanoarchaeota archaeon]